MFGILLLRGVCAGLLYVADKTAKTIEDQKRKTDLQKLIPMQYDNVSLYHPKGFNVSKINNKNGFILYFLPQNTEEKFNQFILSVDEQESINLSDCIASYVALMKSSKKNMAVKLLKLRDMKVSGVAAKEALISYEELGERCFQRIVTFFMNGKTMCLCQITQGGEKDLRFDIGNDILQSISISYQVDKGDLILYKGGVRMLLPSVEYQISDTNNSLLFSAEKRNATQLVVEGIYLQSTPVEVHLESLIKHLQDEISKDFHDQNITFKTDIPMSSSVKFKEMKGFYFLENTRKLYTQCKLVFRCGKHIFIATLYCLKSQFRIFYERVLKCIESLHFCKGEHLVYLNKEEKFTISLPKYFNVLEQKESNLLNIQFFSKRYHTEITKATAVEEISSKEMFEKEILADVKQHSGSNAINVLDNGFKRNKQYSSYVVSYIISDPEQHTNTLFYCTYLLKDQYTIYRIKSSTYAVNDDLPSNFRILFEKVHGSFSFMEKRKSQKLKQQPIIVTQNIADKMHSPKNTTKETSSQKVELPNNDAVSVPLSEQISGKSVTRKQIEKIISKVNGKIQQTSSSPTQSSKQIKETKRLLNKTQPIVKTKQIEENIDNQSNKAVERKKQLSDIESNEILEENT